MPVTQLPGSAERSSRPSSPRATTWSSLRLLLRARAGDQSALDALFRRHWGQLLKWAHGRLPRYARSVAETADLVQEAMLQTFKRLDQFEPRRQRALQAYLREAVRNRIRDELRRAGRAPGEALAEEVRDRAPSPLELAIGAEARDRYLAAVQTLDEDGRLLVVGRFELGYSFEQLALATGRRTPDAARVALRRVLLRLAERMADE